MLFNAGVAVDNVYWGIADYINVLENTEAAYDNADIGALDGEGDYSEQATLIIHDYTDGAKILKRDVDTILSFQNDDIAGLYITDRSGYTAFPTNWATFVSDVAAVVKKNMAS